MSRAGVFGAVPRQIVRQAQTQEGQRDGTRIQLPMANREQALPEGQSAVPSVRDGRETHSRDGSGPHRTAPGESDVVLGSEQLAADMRHAPQAQEPIGDDGGMTFGEMERYARAQQRRQLEDISLQIINCGPPTRRTRHVMADLRKPIKANLIPIPRTISQECADAECICHGLDLQADILVPPLHPGCLCARTD